MAGPGCFGDLTKVGGSAGSGGLVVAITTLVGKFITSSKLDEMRAQNAAQSALLADLGAKMTILIAASERRDIEHDRLDATNRLAKLEARMDAIEKLTDRAVAQ